MSSVATRGYGYTASLVAIRGYGVVETVQNAGSSKTRRRRELRRLRKARAQRIVEPEVIQPLRFAPFQPLPQDVEFSALIGGEIDIGMEIARIEEIMAVAKHRRDEEALLMLLIE